MCNAYTAFRYLMYSIWIDKFPIHFHIIILGFYSCIFPFRWQSFSGKAFGKKGFVKKSIFKTPESTDGKVSCWNVIVFFFWGGVILSHATQKLVKVPEVCIRIFCKEVNFSLLVALTHSVLYTRRTTKGEVRSDNLVW